MDTRIAIHALSCSVDITWCASCGIVIRVTYRDTLVTITWYVSRYVSRYLGRDTIRVSSAQVSRCIDASMHRYDPSHWYDWWFSYSMSPCPSPRPLSVQYLSCHLGSLVWLMIFLLHVALSVSSPALSPVPFLTSRVTGMTDDLPTPCRPVHLLAHPQSSTFPVI